MAGDMTRPYTNIAPKVISDRRLMSIVKAAWAILPLVVISLMTERSANAADPDPSIMSITLPSQIQWGKSSSGSGADTAVLFGDPKKPGLYIMLLRWPPHTMSHPHFHPNDRFLTVLEGTWWVGWGPKYDPNSTVPMTKGSFVRHFGKKIHYDGAKDGEVILEIVGEGPVTETPAEEK
jgi:hypothetical protein